MEKEIFLIDENDEISQKNFIQICNQDSDIIKDGIEKEKSIFFKLDMPGINRNYMPEIPEKSTKLRKLAKCQYYPFISSSISEVKI